MESSNRIYRDALRGFCLNRSSFGAGGGGYRKCPLPPVCYTCNTCFRKLYVMEYGSENSACISRSDTALSGTVFDEGREQPEQCSVKFHFPDKNDSDRLDNEAYFRCVLPHGHLGKHQAPVGTGNCALLRWTSLSRYSREGGRAKHA